MRRLRTLLALVPLSVAPTAGAVSNDHPVSGAALSVQEASDTRPPELHWLLRGRAIHPADLDPSDGSALILGTSSAPGRCRIERPLDPGRWRQLGWGRSVFGWMYHESGPDGTLLMLILPGVAGGFASGALADCELAERQPLPVVLELRAGARRLCAAFGGRVLQNGEGVLRARAAPPPEACSDGDLTVVNQNVLHGLGCSAETEQCRIVDRIELLFDWIEAVGCPDVVAFQEVAEIEDFAPISVREVIEAELPGRCPFGYGTVFEPVSGLDEEMILSRYPVLESEVRVLHLGFPAPIRHVTRARIDHPIGAVDVFTTHLASGSDFATSPCSNFFGGPCPAECVEAGAATVRECQAVQLAAFVAERREGDAPAIVSGDMNARPESFEIAQLRAAGWTDTFLAAGNAECDPVERGGCTSGRADDSLAELESAAWNQSARIDYIFLVPPGPASACLAEIDGPEDGDGDGGATRVLAQLPNPFAATCGPAPDAICWPSDHQGSELDLNCAP